MPPLLLRRQRWWWCLLADSTLARRISAVPLRCLHIGPHLHGSFGRLQLLHTVSLQQASRT